jgi:YjjG family noncanonical pyrimidine nucleotidase
MRKKQYSAILFDFDDTLVSYAAGQRYGLQKAFSTFGIPLKEKFFQIYREENEKLWRLAEKGEISSEELRVKRFELLLERGGIREIEGVKPDLSPTGLCEAYLKNFSKHVEFEPGAEETLRDISGREELKRGLVTNGFTDTQRERLSRAGLADYFHGVFISDEIGVKKPDPEIFRAALEGLGDPAPEEVLIVGDNLISDIMGGKQSGLSTCWYNPSGAEEADEYRKYIDLEIRHLLEILNIL